MELTEFGRVLYDNLSPVVVRRYLNKLRIMIVIERYRRSIALLPLRLKTNKEMDHILRDIKNLPPDRLCFQFFKEEAYYLLITFVPDEQMKIEIKLQVMHIEEDIAELMTITENLRLYSHPIVNHIEMDQFQASGLTRRETVLMSHRLAAAISEIEDRLTMIFICEELTKRGIQHEFRWDDPYGAGSPVLHITGVSNAVDMKCPEFFRNMVRCCIRVDNRLRLTFPFECCMENIPLIRDLPYGRLYSAKICTWIQEVSARDASNMAGKVADTIVERVSRYCHLYSVIYKFAIAYDNFYNKFCNIEAYTFHKLVLSYGEQRDQLLIVGYRLGSKPLSGVPKDLWQQFPVPPKEDFFAVNFGQLSPRSITGPPEIRFRDDMRWNPHALLTGTIRERLNETNDLTGIVHYLVMTSNSLFALSNFMRIRFKTHKVLAQILHQEVQFPFRLKFNLTAATETNLRLYYDYILLDFMLLADGLIAVRDSCRGEARCAGLFRFFFLHSGGRAYELHDPSFQRPTDNSHYSIAEPPRNYDPSEVPSMRCSRTPIVVDDVTMRKTCNFVKREDLYSPIDDYLSTLNYLLHAKIALEAMNNPQGPQTTAAVSLSTVEFIECTADCLHFKATQIDGNGRAATNYVEYKVFVDPQDFCARLTLKYDEEDVATQEELDIIQLFFEKMVYRSKNEMVFQSFVLLCRLTAHRALSSIARVMKFQLDAKPEARLHVQLKLVYLLRESSQTVGRSFASGIVVDTAHTSVMIAIAMRRQKPVTGEKGQPRPSLIFRMVYNTQTNTVRIQNSQYAHHAPQADNSAPTAMPPAPTQEDLTVVINVANAVAEDTKFCPIGVAVQTLHEFMSTGVHPQPYVPRSQPPGSVQPVGSVGPAPSSVGQPPSAQSATAGPGSVAGPSSVHSHLGPGPASVQPGSVQHLAPGSVGTQPPGSVPPGSVPPPQ
ncbi:unnamed protein product [Caenorhabditis auriculariae]|uniref:Rgr-1 C-terminal domain-containing protein n=1 Tax=Caenorhabditis auriculariae TaxID=2777116 RepID=A0A8S1HPG1_9PELO|nr:unnamed protein product [Caenorhabditis auriculariae]